MLTPSEVSLEDRVLDALATATTEVEILDAFSRIGVMVSKGLPVSGDRYRAVCESSRARQPGRRQLSLRARRVAFFAHCCMLSVCVCECAALWNVTVENACAACTALQTPLG